MAALITEIVQLLNQTLSPDSTVVGSATEALDRLSSVPDFSFALIHISTVGENQGLRIAAATYLKNFTRRNLDGEGSSSKISVQFRNRLVQALLQVEPVVLKVLVEAFRVIIMNEFVKQNSWPELVPELWSVIQNSHLISEGSNSQWNTINALTILQAIIRPFQYFLNPSLTKETVPPQLELIAKEILVPLLATCHHLVVKILSIQTRAEIEAERTLLIVYKCIYLAVRSYMPSALVPTLPAFCLDLFGIMDSLSFDVLTSGNGLLRLKTGKRILLIFCALVTRHRKHSDKLMPNIINCVSKIVTQSPNISKLDSLSERILSLAFDVISRVLETGPGWRIVSPHFSFLLDSAIFPVLALNQKDISEWEEDADEYIRKNLSSDLEEISGWKEDLFTARKSAINLLGVISMSKGPPTITSSNSSAASTKRKKSDSKKGKVQCCSIGQLLVLPYLSKFPVPTDTSADMTKISMDYYGVLMVYGGLQDFLREHPTFITTLMRSRVLPLYSLSSCLPYLIATANWVLGELASCLPEEMSTDVYSSLLKALIMPDLESISCYPVRASAACAIAELLENDYLPPEWLPLLQAVVNRTDNDDGNESSILFQLLSTIVEAGGENVSIHIPSIVSALVVTISKYIPPIPEPWPQVVERGFSALAAMAQTWENFLLEEVERNESRNKWASGQATIAKEFSVLLQQAWLTSVQEMGETSGILPHPSCIDDASTLLRSIMRSVSENPAVSVMKVSELLMVWTGLIADWHAWEEVEDLAIFDCIQELVNLQRKCDIKNFFVGHMPSPPAPPVPQRCIIEGVGAFISEAISQYPSATWRACTCVHVLLLVPHFTFETEGVKQSLVIAFSQAAFSRFREIQSMPTALWKPLLLAISTCYLCYPDMVERILEKEDNGFVVWAAALGHISNNSFEPALSAESEIKLAAITLAKVIERLLEPIGGDPKSGLTQECFISLMEAIIRLKELQREQNEDEETEDDDDDEVDEDEETDDDEDSEDDEREETEEEFLDRYAKTAVALENGTLVEEGDADDQDQELELGVLDEVDEERAVLTLIERYNQVLIKGRTFSPQLVTGFLRTFPKYGSFFQPS